MHAVLRIQKRSNCPDKSRTNKARRGCCREGVVCCCTSHGMRYPCIVMRFLEHGWPDFRPYEEMTDGL